MSFENRLRAFFADRNVTLPKFVERAIFDGEDMFKASEKGYVINLDLIGLLKACEERIDKSLAYWWSLTLFGYFVDIAITAPKFHDNEEEIKELKEFLDAMNSIFRGDV